MELIRPLDTRKVSSNQIWKHKLIVMSCSPSYILIICYVSKVNSEILKTIISNGSVTCENVSAFHETTYTKSQVLRSQEGLE